MYVSVSLACFVDEADFSSLVQVPNLNPVITAPGKSMITSSVQPYVVVFLGLQSRGDTDSSLHCCFRSLRLSLTRDPKLLAQFLIAAAAKQGVNLGDLGMLLRRTADRESRLGF